MSNNLTITIGIPTLNRQKYLKNTVLNIIENTIPAVIDIIIVDQTNDNNIINENKVYFNSLNFNVKYIHLEIPSVCKARNTIIKESKSDIIYFIDDDILLTKNTLLEHLYLYENSTVVSTIGKIYNRLNNFDLEQLDISKPNIGTIENFPNENKIDINFKGSGISCNQTYLRKVLLEINGFDENFIGGYYEDADIVNRIRARQYKIGFNPKALILHIKAPMGGLRFDKIQPISFHKKFYSFLFYYIRNFKFNFRYLIEFYKVLRAGPLMKQNIFTLQNGLFLWLKLPFYIFKSIKNKNSIISLLNNK
jgi:GT2 family glycosyltransferase